MSLTPIPLSVSWQPAVQARTSNAAILGELLGASRSRTLALIDCFDAALGADIRVPLHPHYNPPIWELGHVGWFQNHWIRRNEQRANGTRYDPALAMVQRAAIAHDAQADADADAVADALYDSSHVCHTSRWDLPLPSLAQTRQQLNAGLQRTLELLAQGPHDSDALYFYRLALFHEDMHSEAAVNTAQTLGIPVDASLLKAAQHAPLHQALQLHLPACRWQLGNTQPGFSFDNELGGHDVVLPSFKIDTQVVNWDKFLGFIEDGGYANPRWWSEEGWQWRTTHAHAMPRYLRNAGLDGGWQCQRFGQWHALDKEASATHLNLFEVQAWCLWAGVQLPTEAQWEYAAVTQPDFVWGNVWEWTASKFEPYPGFVPHPYQDYSQPWFNSRQVLRGASLATTERMAHPLYRNFFEPDRNDLLSGFRTCSPA